MTTFLLKGSKAKITRAKEQMRGLQLEFQRFSDGKPYALRQEKEQDTGKLTLVYYPNAPIPENWVVIIGEILFNLRSALDNAVHELTVREQGTPVKNSEFPIFEDKLLFSATKKNGDPAPGSGIYKISGLSQKTRDYIESVQPYKTIGCDEVSILSIIHEMNIRDKHKEILLCRQMFQVAKLTLLEDVHGFIALEGPPLNGTLDERTVMYWLETVNPLDESKVYMDTEIALQIVFDESCFSGFKKKEKVIPILQHLIGATEQILIGMENTL